jgi:hypothetical protein
MMQELANCFSIFDCSIFINLEFFCIGNQHCTGAIHQFIYSSYLQQFGYKLALKACSYVILQC